MLSKFIVPPHYFVCRAVLILNLLLVGCSQSLPLSKIPRPIDTVSLLPDAGSPNVITANPETGYVYVASSHFGRVSVFQKDQFITVLSVGEQSRPAIAIDVEHDWTYVTNEYGNSVSIIQGKNVVETLDVAGRSPTDVTVEPHSGWAYVVTGGSKKIGPDGLAGIEGNVTVLNGPRIVGVIPLGRTLTKYVTADPINGYVYVGAVGGDVIVIKELKEITRYNVGATVTSLEADPRTGDVYVLARSPANYDLHRFREGKLIEQVKVEGDRGSVDKLKVHPTTGDVYVLDFVRQEVVVVRPAESLDGALVVYDRVPVGREPSKMAIDPYTGNVYVTNLSDNSVTAIQGTEVLTTYQVGWYPYGIGVNPANGWVYVANTNEHSVTILGFK